MGKKRDDEDEDEVLESRGVFVLKEKIEALIVDVYVHRSEKLRGVYIHGQRQRENGKTVTAVTTGACARQNGKRKKRKRSRKETKRRN
jgi:hypothetical protein